MGMSSLHSCFCQLRSCSSQSLCFPAHRGVRRQPSTIMDRSWAQHQASLGSWVSWTVTPASCLSLSCSWQVFRYSDEKTNDYTLLLSLTNILFSCHLLHATLCDTRVRLVLLCYFIPSFLCVNTNLHGPWEVVVGRDEPQGMLRISTEMHEKRNDLVLGLIGRVSEFWEPKVMFTISFKGEQMFLWF